MSKLSETIKDLEKNFGKGILQNMGDTTSIQAECISTGSMILDKALGCGGVPCGRITEIYGPESSGKTTIALHVIAQAQMLGKVCAFIDAEHALDMQYAEAIGVDKSKLFLSQPDYGEQALEITNKLIETGDIGVIVVDSVAALTPRAEIEGEMGDSHMALQARLMSQALRKMTSSIHRTNTVVIFINQLRMKIGIVFGNPETTSGGNALKFYSSVRMDVRRAQALKNANEQIGNLTRVKVVKNKMAPPFKVAEFEIKYGTGIDAISEIVILGVKSGIIEKSGSWYSYNGERIGQGSEKVREFLIDNEDTLSEIKGAINGPN